MEPVLSRHIILRDGNEAGEARFGGEEIVRARVEPPCARIVADGKETSLLVVEDCEIHRHGDRSRTLADGTQPVGERGLLLRDLVAAR